MDKWHQVLGDLRSMEISLPGALGLFSHMQKSLNYVQAKRLIMAKGTHQDLEDF